MKSAVRCKLLLYADDSVLLVSDKSVKSIEKILIEELHNINKWLVENKLSLHLGKTESILFGSKQKINKSPKLNIKYNGTQIESKPTVKYLGSELDQYMSGEDMAQKSIKRISSRTKFLSRKSKYLDRETMKMLASALVQCHFDYACTSWYSSLTKKTQNKLQVSQNKLIRNILKLEVQTHLAHCHFKELNWLPVGKRVTQIKLGHVHQIVNGTAPSYLLDYFTAVRDRHNFNTRHSQVARVVPRYNSLVGKKGFRYTGATEWNLLPTSALTIVLKSNFKKYVKQHLLEMVLKEESNLQ
jgi:hypothetical protein